jgi:hypothetical protein
MLHLDTRWAKGLKSERFTHFAFLGARGSFCSICGSIIGPLIGRSRGLDDVVHPSFPWVWESLRGASWNDP